ncbi:MAG: proteasome subunit beta, partial [Acidimicrobiia bacterium]|nr:proteasome subunit beta [Acidimicrobiia bacterium]
MIMPRLPSLPSFVGGEDPGPSFTALLAAAGHRLDGLAGVDRDLPAVAHATTVVALRHRDGVVMAGDRRATAGNLISHRTIEKVYPAGRHAGVAIAGAAGPSMEMVRLFQLQLEHYEKVEGQPLSLEGQANQLSQMVRANFASALRGLVVVPLFAGWDERCGCGRLFQYDVTGGRYEEQDFAAGGSGSLHAGTVVKLGFRPGLPPADAVDLAVSALFEAADEDAATGGPDLVRGIFPVVANIDADGYQRLDDATVEARFRALLAPADGPADAPSDGPAGAPAGRSA